MQHSVPARHRSSSTPDRSPHSPISPKHSRRIPSPPPLSATFPRGARSPIISPSALHSTSSLRDPPPNATPPGGSRSPSASGPRDDDRDDRRKGKGRERERDEPIEDDLRPEKRSRLGRTGGGRPGNDSPSKPVSGPSPSSETAPSKRGPPQLPPIKPIGFAASREARREDGTADRAIPSPVVMGFDFKTIDEEQLKTVRDTISIKEQQQALIAQRRKEMAASQPTTPRELTFKGWTPKDPEKRGVGARREKIRDKVERMSIVTTSTDKDVVPGSKSAPLNQGLASQQQSPREPPSGSQTAMPHNILPPMHYPSHGHGGHGGGHHLADLRTAPLSHSRRHHEESAFARQQQPYYQAQQQAQHRSGASGSASNQSASRSQQQQQDPRGDPRYPPDLGPRSALPPTTADRRNFSVPSLQQQHSSSRYPLSPHAPPGPPPPGPPLPGPGPGPSSARPSNGVSGHRANGYSVSPSPPNHLREQFLAPFSQLYDMLSSVDGLRYQLQDMIHRTEQAYQNQMQANNEFKSTAAQASSLLGTLQQSADSLKEMVRYEVDRSAGADRREVDELRDRVRSLEDRLSQR